MDFTKHVIDANPDLIYVKDQNGTIVLANTAFAQIHQLDVHSLLSNGKLDNDYSFDRDLEVLKNEKTISFEELYKVDRDTKKWYQTTKKVFDLEDGGRYLISISADITSHKKYMQLAEKLIKGQESFHAGIRSELQASAKAIASMGKLMRSSSLTKEQEDYLTSILTIADHLVEAPSISLPKTGLESKKVNAEKVPCKEAPNQENSRPKLDSITALLVEDDTSSIYLTTELLKSWGVTVDVAYSGEHALKQVSEKEYAIIIMDIQMPGIDGFECTNQIRQMPNLNQKTPIIAFTANKNAFDKKSYRLAGFTDYLYKPYEEADLFLMISRNTMHEPNVQQPGISHQPWKNQALYDFSGLGSLMDDPVFVRKMQLLFVTTVPQQLSSLTDALQSQNWQAAVHVSHRLKSVFANIKVEAAAAALNVIEENATSKKNVEESQRLLLALREISETIVADFTSQLQANV